MSVHISFVGQLAAEVDGIRADATQLPGRRATLAFAYLVAERGRPVPREELADVVWDGTLPPTWQPALRGLISKIREFLKALGFHDADVLTSFSGCYRLALPAGTTVDVELVDSDVDGARRALQAGELTRARSAAERACRIARQPFLPGHEGAWVETRRATLHQMLITSLEVLVDSDLAAGHGEQAVGPARELVSLDPFRDSAHERLLRAHASAGDRAEALRVYDHYRRFLAAELGVGPSPEVEASYVRVLHATSVAPHRQTSRVTQPRAAVPATGTFVGRRSELDRLLSAWLDAQDRQRRTVLVAGEAGIGKTRLAAEFAAVVERDGATVLTGRCDHHLSVPYLPLREALGRHLATVPQERLHALLGAPAAELVRFWPELAWRQVIPQPLTPPTSDVDSYVLYEALLVVLDEIAIAGPVLLVIDDVHGADEATLELLRSLARAHRPPNLMTVLTYRDDEATVRVNVGAALSDLLRAPGAELVTLDGLAADDVAFLISATLGGPLGEGGTALGRVLRERTKGNPFLIGELLRHLSATGALVDGDLAGVAIGPAVDDVPESLHWVINQRVAGLGAAAERVIAAVAVIGHQPDLTLLERVTDLDHDGMLTALDVAVKTRLLEERPGVPRRYAFHHALVRDLVYRGLSADERMRIHRRVGEALEDQTDGSTRLVELADHFALAGDDFAEQAALYARRAGERALEEHLYEEAARRFRQALSTLDRVDAANIDLGRRCELLLLLGQAWTAAGEASLAMEANLQAADAARASGSAEFLARAALGLGGPAAFWSTELDRDRPVQLLQEALAAVGPGDGRLHALLLARLAGWMVVSSLLAPEARPPQVGRDPRFSDAVAMARRLGDRRTLAAVIADEEMTWNGMVRPGGPNAALTGTAELDHLAVELGDESLTYRASLVRAGALLAVGDLDGFDRLAERERRIAEERHIPHHRWLSVTLSATHAMVIGDFATAERLVDEARKIGGGPLRDAATFAYGAQLMFLRWLQGRPAEIEAVLERLIAEQRPGARLWPRYLLLAYAGLGRDASARRQLSAAMAEGLAGRGTAELVALVAACARLRDVAAADEIYRLLAPWANHHLSAGYIYLGAADHHLGILAATADRWETALRHFRVAMAAHEDLGALPWLALTSHAYARKLRDRGEHGDGHRAMEMEAAARVTARLIGMELPG